MIYTLVAASSRQPDWVTTGVAQYAKRLEPRSRLEVVQVALGVRQKGASPAQARREEADRLLKRIPPNGLVIALDGRGQSPTTRQLADRLADWSLEHRACWLLIGGPDGLDQACIERANWRWSLSNLTFPHGLVQVIVAEAIYRAEALLAGHPYHRE